MGTLPIQLFGSDELKERFLPKCATGEWSPAFALSEPEAGSDPAGMRTTAVQDGDDWIINGTKNWISNLGVANFYIVFAVTDRDSRRLSAFVVEADRPGFSVGKLEHKLGIRASPTGQPIFEDVRVREENIIGQVGKGPVESRLARSSALASAPPRRPSASLRRHRLRRRLCPANASSSESRSTTPGNRVQAHRYGNTHGRSSRAALQGVCDGRSEAILTRAKYSSMAKVFCSDTAMARDYRGRASSRRLRLRQGVPVERMMRDAKITQIYEGTNEIQRLVIARTLK